MGTGAIGIVALCGFTAVRSLCSRAGRAGRKFFFISVRVGVTGTLSFFASRFVVVPSSAPAAIRLSANSGGGASGCFGVRGWRPPVLIYDLAKQHLVEQLKYPPTLMNMEYDKDFPIMVRGVEDQVGSAAIGNRHIRACFRSALDGITC